MCNDTIMYYNRTKHSNVIMRKINITIEIEDNNFVENKLHEALDGLLGLSMIDYKVLTDNKQLYETDSNFRQLCKAEKLAKRAKNDYISRNKLKL